MPPHSLIIIGGGPGGFAAALEAARHKISVTLVERQTLGGTCLNRGCVPSKYYLSRGKDFSEIPATPSEAAAPALAPAMARLLACKNEIVGTIRQRMEQAANASAVARLSGTARLAGPKSVDVTLADGTHQRLDADAIILATGTEPVRPSIFPVHPCCFDSTTILDIDRRPEHLVVVGGGYIGCELACAFHGLGSRVTLIEKEERLLPTQPEFEAAAGILERSFGRRGLTLKLAQLVVKVEVLGERHLAVTTSSGERIECDALLVAIGRAARFEELNLAAAGLVLHEHRLTVNRFMQTEVLSIYAIGDLVSPLPLAHVASREAEVAVAHLFGEEKTIDYSAIPRCVYTWPEAAAVGLSEAQAREAGFAPRVDRYHYAASAKALVEEESEGQWVIVSDSESRKLLGGQIVGAHATELIHLLSLSLRAGFRVDDIADTVFAHPSLSEGFQEIARRIVQSPRSKVQSRP